MVDGSSSPVGKGAGAWSCPLTSIYCRGQEWWSYTSKSSNVFMANLPLFHGSKNWQKWSFPRTYFQVGTCMQFGKLHKKRLHNFDRLVSRCGARLSPLGTSTTIGPIVPALDVRWFEGGHRWNKWQIKQNNSEKKCPSTTLSAADPAWPIVGSKPGSSNRKLVTNRLTHITNLETD
jgi:hypothetical protein